MSLFHGYEGFFVKRLKRLNRERIKKNGEATGRIFKKWLTRIKKSDF
jgi:hypothetical protein